MLHYSVRGLSARVRFYSPYNEVTIIVEDTASENFYTVLFERLFGDAPKIGRVLGVGGKEQVLERYRRFNKTANGTLEFYLVDGDFDELVGRTLPHDRRLYRLARYDIESYLLEPAAIAKVAEEQNPIYSADYYKRRLNYDQWHIQLINIIQRLVACFVVLHKLRLAPQGGRSIDRFMLGYADLPDAVKMEAFIDGSRSCQTSVDRPDFDSLMECMVSKMGCRVSDRLRWISGKDILLPIVVRQLRRETGSNISIKSLRFRLMKYCEFDELVELKARVRDTWRQ